MSADCEALFFFIQLATVDCDCDAGTSTYTIEVNHDFEKFDLCPLDVTFYNPDTGETTTITLDSGEIGFVEITVPINYTGWTVQYTYNEELGHDSIFLPGPDCCPQQCCATIDISVDPVFVDVSSGTDITVTNVTTGETQTLHVPHDGTYHFTFVGLTPGTYTFHTFIAGNGPYTQEVVVTDGDLDCGGPPPPPECPPLEIKGFIPCRDTSILGYGQDLRVYLVTRGATAVIAELNPTSGNFTRVIDDCSTLDLDGVITGRLGDVCCDGWSEVRPWATEILVYRDGRDAWCGPVTDVNFGYGTVHVEADDLTIWWSKRKVKDLSFVNADFATIFEAVHESAMEIDPSPNITIVVDPTGIHGSREVLGTQAVYASDIIAELAKTGLDYTCYGRTVVVQGEAIDADPFLTLLDEHWSTPPAVRYRGNEQATRVTVRGKGVRSTVQATAAYTDYYGIIERVFDEDTITDQASCDKAAQTRLDLLKDPLYIETPQGAQLKATAPVTLEQLIPGMIIRVDSQSTCHAVVADFRLQKVEVNFDGSVSIDLQPVGTLAQLEAG